MLFVPTLLPLSFHWNVPDPPPLSAATKVTVVPAHIVVADAVMLTNSCTESLTIIVILFDVTGERFAHPRDELIITFTTLPFTGVEVV